MKNSNSKEAVSLKIPDKGAKENVNLVAYVVDNNGSLIESVPFKNSTATLKQTRSAMEDGQQRVYIAQTFPKDFDKTINERLLLNAGAYSVVQNFMGNEILISRLPITIYNPILIDNCLITGTITNNVIINGEAVENSPVDGARVHIEQVGRRLIWPLPPIIYDTIPSWVIDEISNEIINIQPVIEANANAAEEIEIASKAEHAVNRESLKAHPLTLLPDDVLQGIKSSSRETVIETLSLNHDLLIPYICYWEWLWPWFYYVVSDTVVYTDCNGNFDLEEFFLPCCPPNIYVWVEVFINGQWQTAYKPWVPCGTYWDYTCDSPININIGDYNILPCGSTTALAGECVYLNSINLGTTIRSIQQLDAPNLPNIPYPNAAHPTNASSAIGLTTDGNFSPYGSNLSFMVQFGVNLYNAEFNGKKITNYRWRYTQLADAYLQAPVSPASGFMNTPVYMPFYYYIPAPSGPGFDEVTPNFQLGPFPDNNHNPMYIIPQPVPTDTYAPLPTGASNPSIPANAQFPAWYYPYPFVNSMSFNSAAFADGLYEFTLELLDSTGTVVPVTVSEDAVFLIDTIPASSEKIDADGLPENYVIHDASDNAIAFNFKMRIDNTPCYAGISDAVVNNIVSPPCGIATYTNTGDPVQLVFQAGHPHNFATYEFAVKLGNIGYVPLATSAGFSQNANVSGEPMVTNAEGYEITQVSMPTPTPENEVSNMDEYSSTGLTVADMMEPSASQPGGACPAAAFAETLDVWARHTNGVNRLSQYDAYDVAAFALVLPCPPCNG